MYRAVSDMSLFERLTKLQPANPLFVMHSDVLNVWVGATLCALLSTAYCFSAVAGLTVSKSIATPDVCGNR